MECEDDTSLCLNFFNDTPGQYFLQNDELQDTLPVEPIFTEIDNPYWDYQSFESSLSTEGDGNEIGRHQARNISLENVSTLKGSKNTEVNCHLNDIQSVAEDYLSITGNEILVQINTSNKEHEENSHFMIVNDDEALKENILEQSSKQLNNISIYAISKDSSANIKNSVRSNVVKTNTFLINSPCTQPKIDNIRDFYTVVMANKCKFCSYLCESTIDITEHLYNIHGNLLRNSTANEDKKLNEKIKSFLNTPINPKTASNDNNLVLHMCDTCNKFYWEKELLNEHMTSVHGETCSHNNNFKKIEIPNFMNNKKQIESLTINSSSEDQKHPKSLSQTSPRTLIQTQPKRKKFRCSFKGCAIRFFSDELKQKHEQLHTTINGIKAFQCFECNEQFSVWRKCALHFWRKHKMDMGLFSCPICDLKFYSSDNVNNHLAIHNDDKPYLCNECGKTFKTQNQLRNHQYIHVKNQSEENQRTCNKCNQNFVSIKSLQKHIQDIHEKVKKYKCNICGHLSSRKDMYQLHIRKHNGEKPYECGICDYKTSDPNCLRRHSNRHTGKMKYFCHLCNYKAIQITALKYHLENKHKENQNGPFTCSLCSYVTEKSTEYMSHRQMHDEEMNHQKSFHV